nr:MAG TPA: hypothetical protein [Caudoviricetes sp.]
MTFNDEILTTISLTDCKYTDEQLETLCTFVNIIWSLTDGISVEDIIRTISYLIEKYRYTIDQILDLSKKEFIFIVKSINKEN